MIRDDFAVSKHSCKFYNIKTILIGAKSQDNNFISKAAQPMNTSKPWVQDIQYLSIKGFTVMNIMTAVVIYCL